MFGIDTVQGLPVHALIVHFAVVLVPVSVVALIITCWKVEWRRRYVFVIAVLALAGASSAFVAVQSGKLLEHSVERAAAVDGKPTINAEGESELFGDHPEEGETAELAAIVFAAVAIGLFTLDRLGPERGLTETQMRGAYALCCAVGIFALATMIVVGHSGAALVWKDLGNYVSVTR